MDCRDKCLVQLLNVPFSSYSINPMETHYQPSSSINLLMMYTTSNQTISMQNYVLNPILILLNHISTIMYLNLFLFSNHIQTLYLPNPIMSLIYLIISTIHLDSLIKPLSIYFYSSLPWPSITLN